MAELQVNDEVLVRGRIRKIDQDEQLPYEVHLLNTSIWVEKNDILFGVGRRIVTKGTIIGVSAGVGVGAIILAILGGIAVDVFVGLLRLARVL